MQDRSMPGCLHTGKIPTVNTKYWVVCMQEASNLHYSYTNSD